MVMKLSEVQLYALIGFIFLLLAITTSLIAMHVEYVSDYRSREIDLSKDGLFSPLFALYGYSPDKKLVSAEISMKPINCSRSLNVTLIQVISLEKNITRVQHIIVEPNYVEKAIVKNMHTLLIIDPINCSVRLDLNALFEERPYMLLSIPSLAFLVVGTIFLVLSVFGRIIYKVYVPPE